MNQEKNIMDCKIAVVGLGGVGGYLGGMLANTFPHVSVVARGGRYDSTVKNGIVLHSDLNGEIVSRPEAVCHSSSELAPMDYVFIAVKNYSLGEALSELKAGSAVAPGTVLIPVMNGVDCGGRIREAFPENPVVDSVIYIVSMANADYSIDQQGDFADLRIGTRNRRNPEGIPASEKADSDRPALKEDPSCLVNRLSELLKTAGLRYKISNDVETDIWRKYILNCCFNVVTAAWNLPIGGIREDPAKIHDYGELAREAYRLGLKKGVKLKEEHLVSIIERFSKYADSATSSLQRDVRDGKRAEIETFSGYVVREAKKEGIEVPVSERYYRMLLAKQA